MTTDTAVRVTRMVVQDKGVYAERCDVVVAGWPVEMADGAGGFFAVPVDKIPYVDHPELKINKNESTEMPFRYVVGKDGRPIMPEVRS